VNLKTAARRLGVHYQTAYRWVRTGQLVAVKVGAGYEISDAALERFQAQRAALERIPDVTPRTTPIVPSARVDALNVLDAMLRVTTVDAAAVCARAVNTVATVIGDGAVLQLSSGDPPNPVLAFDHYDAERSVLMGAVLRFGRTEGGSFTERAANSESAVLVPQVPQREVRSMLAPEFHQVLGDVGFYSAISAPISISGQFRGTLFAGRDTPGRPYTVEDRDFVIAVASRVGLASTRADRGRQAWDLRARIMSDLAEHGGYSDAIDRAAAWIANGTLEHDAAVALVNLERNVVTLTKPFAAMVGTSATDAVGTPIESLVTPTGELQATFERMVNGELDYCSVVTQAAVTSAAIVLDGAILRGPDATPCCVVYVAHERPEPAPTEL
jgi:excisionase family DNA binding protein